MYFFGYASSMILSQMRRICGWDCQVLGVAELPDFEFGLDFRGYGTIRPKKGEKVYGVLYSIGQSSLDKLDEFHSYPNVFNRLEVPVNHEDEKKSAWVYLEPVDQFGGKHVSPDYFRGVIAAAEENRLPEEWINKLKSFL